MSGKCRLFGLICKNDVVQMRLVLLNPIYSKDNSFRYTSYFILSNRVPTVVVFLNCIAGVFFECANVYARVFSPLHIPRHRLSP